jgi:hypothetical protein
MNTAGVPDRLLLDYRLDSGVAVVKVTGELMCPPAVRSAIACFGSSPMKTITV